MTLIIFKYCLPALLGYILFVGISGRFNPLKRPKALRLRPSWFLGAWTGVIVASVIGLGLNLAYRLPLESVPMLLEPSAWLLGSLLLPGILISLLYRRSVHKELDRRALAEMSVVQAEAHTAVDAQTIEAAETQSESLDGLQDSPQAETTDSAADMNADLDSVLELSDSDLETDDALVEQLESVLDQVEDDQMSIGEIAADAGETDATADANVDLADQATLLLDSGIEPLGADATLDTEADFSIELPLTTSDLESMGTAQQSAADTHGPTTMATSDDPATDDVATQSNDTVENSDATADVVVLSMPTAETADLMSLNGHAANSLSSEEQPFDELLAEKLADAQAEIGFLRTAMSEEMELREQTERHLRAVRNAMAVLESESRGYEASKAEALIGLEEELDIRIREAAKSDARLGREQAKRVEVENEVVGLKQDLLKAKRDVRSSTEARARALHTANKTIAFARQAVHARTRLERQIKDNEEALRNRQEMISSLIKALEKEKRKTQADVSVMAKQLVLHEKQLNARRSLEEVARSVEGKLTNRLVKKVAKARPLVNG